MRFERDRKMNLNFQPNELGTVTQNEAPQVNIITSVHNALRGRYHWAAALAAILGATGALVGFGLTEPVYTSSGLVEVVSELNPVLGGIREQEKLDAFDSVVAAQADFIASSRNLNLAAQYLADSNSDWPLGAVGLASLQSSLDTNRKRGQRIIHVNVTHADPQLAYEALGAILDSYKKLYDDDQSSSLTNRKETLTDLSNSLVRKLDTSRNQLAGDSLVFGTTDLEQLRSQYFNDLQELGKRLDEVEENLITARARSNPENDIETEGQTEASENENSASDTQDTNGEDDALESIENLASIDTRLSDLVAQRSSLMASLEAASLDYGPAHIKIRDLKRALEKIKSQITVRLSELRALIKSGQISIIDNSSLDQIQSVEVLTKMKADYMALIETKR